MAASNPPLQIRPNGLLGFFDIKRGSAPVLLGDNLAPVMQLTDWYLQTNSEILIDPVGGLQISATGVTSFGFAVVPQTEWWALLEWNCRLQTGVGETITTAVGVAMRGQVFQVGDPIAVAASQLANARMNRRTLFLPPGDGLIVDTQQLTGVVDVVPAARIVRLPI